MSNQLITSSIDNYQNLILSIARDITAIQNREHLDKLIKGTLSPALGFTHSTVFVLNDEGSEIINFLGNYSNIIDRYQEAVFTTKISFNHKINGSAAASYYFDVDDLVQKRDVATFLTNSDTVENCSLLSFQLVKGDECIGLWLLLFEKEDKRQEIPTALCELIASNITFAILNIKAQETIEKNKKEREILQALNIDFATIGKKQDLLKFIHFKLSSILNFRHHWIATVNEDQLTMSTFMQDTESKTKSHPKYKELTYARYPIADKIFNRVILAGEPQIFDLQQILATGTLPEYLQINYESGIRKVVMQSLEIAGKLIGVWALYLGENDEVDHNYINLVKDIANQFSIAVGNIIANEIIQSRQTEQELLLKLSCAITSVKDKEDLLKILKFNLKKILDFKRLLILTMNDGDPAPQIFLSTDPTAENISLAIYNPGDSDIFSKCILTPDPLIFDLEALTNAGYDDLPPYLKTSYESGIKKVVIIRFSKSEGVFGFGVLLFDHDLFFDKEKQNLIKGISHQISIAISNIVINGEITKREEKINKQLAEINQYREQLEDQTSYLKEEIEITQNYGDIIGDSMAVRKTFKLVSQVAMSDSTVLIQGETGTGKELIARAIHNTSPRKDKLMVKVNCAALPPGLIESELFGHERGSFTGATEQRLGKFELAKNSTLFLDEIGEMPLDLQVKLLRALQEKEIERVGGNKTIKVDVRIVAATNRDLAKEVAEGRFRSDLYYRLNIFPISLPPLRDRKEDIPLLAAYFVRRFAKKAGRQITTFSDIAMHHMMQYNWPGNVRELEHMIERCVLLSSGDAIKFADLQPFSRPALHDPIASETVLKTIDENERDHILRILKYCGGKIAGNSGAAQILGVPAGTLYSKLKKLGIKREHSI